MRFPCLFFDLKHLIKGQHLQMAVPPGRRQNEGEQCSNNVNFISQEETTHGTCKSNEL